MRLRWMSAVCIVSLVQAASTQANETSKGSPPDQTNPQVDYAGFAALTQELREYRSNRLVTMDKFIDLASKDNAIILDTRSAAAFRVGHIKGAINLPFSDFTEPKLAKILGDTTRPILIYCNNNFQDTIFPVARKSAPLALNIPTFINLYGYGYKNIYELNDTVLMSDPRLQWVSSSLGTEI